MTDLTFFIDKNNQWEPFTQGVVRKIMGHDKNLMMVKVRFNKDAMVPIHSHIHVQCSLIESGKFEVVIGKSAMILGKGDGFFVPPGIEHMVTALDEGIIIDTFNPAREDLIHNK